MIDRIRPLFTVRFVKFGVVGASGVLVNLGVLALCADVFELHLNLSSAIAILASINSNFVINEFWTFSDRRKEGQPTATRWLHFHVVSILGGLFQWTVFIVANLSWLLLQESGELSRHLSAGGGGIGTLSHIVLSPPEVGAFKYVSQMIGITVATFWNFFANFHWTWGERNPDPQAPPTTPPRTRPE